VSHWSAAGAAIRAAFADAEAASYHRDGGPVIAGLAVIVMDERAGEFSGPGSSLRKITYEVDQAELGLEPSKRDTLRHRGRKLVIEDITRRDDVGAWWLVISDGGAA
jgi:hypothetical protein